MSGIGFKGFFGACSKSRVLGLLGAVGLNGFRV